MNPVLEQKLAHLPTRPGVYQHKDAEGTVLYVGKAKNLRNRVRSYFQQSRPKDGRLQILVRKIADVEVIVTDTEAEALIAEQQFIKRHRPLLNVKLRDDKSYPYIGISLDEEFPRVYFTRERHRSSRAYFGPYATARRVRETLELLGKLVMRRLGKQFGIPGQIAMEQVMACGLGPCYVCVKTFEVDGEKVLRRVCVEGPVFDMQETLGW